MTRNPLTVLIAAFVVSRIAFYLAGVRYELEGYGFHLLDIHLLRDDLTSSVWHMHMQPPLLNLFIGGVLKLPGPAEKPFATGCNLLLGLALVLSCYLLLVELRTPRTVAMLVTLVGVVASPSYILAENWGYPVTFSACFLVVTALFLARYLRTGRAGYGLGFSCVAATIVLLNSTYQWIWLIPVLAIAVIAARKHWRKILPLLLVPFLVVGLWYVKNAVMFGTFTTSSWVGMNLAKLTLFGTSTKNINRLVLQGKLTPLARVPPFNAPYVYIPRFIHVTQHTGVPALDELYDYQTGAPPFIEPSSGGTCCGNEGVLNTNFNNNIYIKLSAKYLHDDIVFIEDEPGLYIHEVGLSLGNWFTPSDQYSFFLPNRQHVQGYVNAYDSFVEWQGHLDLDVYKMTQVEHLAPSPWTLSYQAILASALTLFGLPLLIRRRRGDPVIRGTLGFIWFTVLYATLATSLVELGENNRFRLELGPLPLIGATVIIVAVLRFVSSWWAAKRASVGVPHAAADIQDVRTTQTQPGD